MLYVTCFVMQLFKIVKNFNYDLIQLYNLSIDNQLKFNLKSNVKQRYNVLQIDEIILKLTWINTNKTNNYNTKFSDVV